MGDAEADIFFRSVVGAGSEAAVVAFALLLAIRIEASAAAFLNRFATFIAEFVPLLVLKVGFSGAVRINVDTSKPVVFPVCLYQIYTELVA